MIDERSYDEGIITRRSIALYSNRRSSGDQQRFAYQQGMFAGDLKNRCYQRHEEALFVDKKKNISYTFHLGV